MSGRKKVFLAACIVLVTVLGGVAVAGVAGSLSLWESREDVYHCTENFSEMTDFSAVMAVGNSYFGGGPKYNIFCAKLAYTKALAIDDNRDPMPWYQLGRIHFIQGDFEVAIYRLNTVIERFGTSTIPNVHYMLGLTYGYRAHEHGAVEDWQRAEEEFALFNQLDPQSPWSRVDLAWVLFSQKKYEAMKAPLLEALALQPANPWVLNMYGLAQLNTGDRTGAHDSFRKAERSLANMTPETWGQVYPGNDPARWRSGLMEMRELVEKNKQLAAD